MRNAGQLQEARALRQGWRHYWNAKALDRTGRAREAYVEAKRAFDAMPTTDRPSAFLEFGSGAVMLLHDLPILIVALAISDHRTATSEER